MKIFQLVLLCFLCVAQSYGQAVRVVVEITKEKKSKKSSPKVEVQSVFHGGDSAWVKSIEKNIKRSVQSVLVDKRIKKGKYVASVKYFLSKDGSLSEIACENDPGFGICEEVIRVLKKSKKWTPATGPGPVRGYRK